MKLFSKFLIVLLLAMLLVGVESAYKSDERDEALKAGKKIKYERI